MENVANHSQKLSQDHTQAARNLLRQVAHIRRRYTQELAKNGRNWNVFYAAGKHLYKEEMFHSHFLAVLLARQNEQKENLFLKCFLEQVAQNNPLETDFSAFYAGTVKISTEKAIGSIKDNYASGGRIDILIEKGNRQILIENKIYAADQPRQLMRYHRKYPQATLIYLTLDGKKPSAASAGNLQDSEYVCLSYKTDVTAWLAACVRYLAGKPEELPLQTAITEYTDVINDLTGQGGIQPMTQQISDLLSQNKENLASARDVCQAITEARNQVLNDKFFVPLTAFVKKHYGQEVELKTKKRKGAIEEFSIWVPEWQKMILRFNYELGGICGLGFKNQAAIEADGGKISRFVKEHCEKDLQTLWWPLIYRIDTYPFWNFNITLSLFDGADDILTYYENKIEDLFAVARQLKASGIEL